MKRVMLAAIVLSVAQLAHGQTSVALLQWDYDALPTEIATYTQSVTVDGAAITGTPTCAAFGTTRTTCSIPAPALASGTHTVVVNATLAGNTIAVSKSNFGAGSTSPKQPGNFRLTIQVTLP